MIAAVNRFSTPLLFALAIALVHASLWFVINRALPLIDAPPLVHGFAYSGFQLGQSPLEKTYPTTDQLINDLRILEPYTDRIRTYGAVENPEVVALAGVVGLKVTAGAWLGPVDADNQREIRTLLAKSELYPNIERLIIGNEALLRNDLSVPELILYLDQVKAQTNLPISTAEPWHVWLKNPQLVKYVDFIAVHLLPYHEGVPVEQAVDYSIERYNELMEAFPRKKIVITEIGWPSKGPAIGASVASQVNQAHFVREFLAKTAYENYDYYLMEAIDQPWKVDIEGWAGPYWGMLDGERKLKYSLVGAVPRDNRWIDKAVWATLLAFLPIMFIAYRFRQWRLGGRISMAVLMQACITTLVVAWNLPSEYYYTLRDFIILIGLIIAMLMTSAVL
ncbi:MAG: benzoate transporter, partial [Nitrosomonadales bacterium]|nr:benzoate transporter [Nitrosomonadales bacterium]